MLFRFRAWTSIRFDAAGRHGLYAQLLESCPYANATYMLVLWIKQEVIRYAILHAHLHFTVLYVVAHLHVTVLYVVAHQMRNN